MSCPSEFDSDLRDMKAFIGVLQRECAERDE
jgi:hypothetical protein